MRQQEGEPEPLHAAEPGRAARAEPRGRPARWRRDPSTATPARRSSREAIREGARGRDSAVTMLLETAATRVASPGDAGGCDERAAARPGAAAATGRRPRRLRARRREPPGARRARAASRPKPRRRRGAFTRFMALMFLFLLIATVVAAIVIVNLDGSGTQDFERVVSEHVQDQIDGIRDLIDDATRVTGRASPADAQRLESTLSQASARRVIAGRLLGCPSSASAVGRHVGQDPAVRASVAPAHRHDQRHRVQRVGGAAGCRRASASRRRCRGRRSRSRRRRAPAPRRAPRRGSGPPSRPRASPPAMLAGVADHVGVREIDDPEAERPALRGRRAPAVDELAAAASARSSPASGRRSATSRGRRHEAALLAGVRVLLPTVEEVGDVRRTSRSRRRAAGARRDRPAPPASVISGRASGNATG